MEFCTFLFLMSFPLKHFAQPLKTLKGDEQKLVRVHTKEKGKKNAVRIFGLMVCTRDALNGRVDSRCILVLLQLRHESSQILSTS